jgi:uncharacterized protein YndB with AHSA1/START domain
MAIEVTVESTIERPPDEVFAAIADLDAWPGWLIASGIRSVERDRSGPPVEGERLIVEQNAAGRFARFDAEVMVIEPGVGLALRGRDRDGISIEIEASVHSVLHSEQATHLLWSIRVGLPLRYRVFESMARPQVERAARLDVESLRLRLEGATRS